MMYPEPVGQGGRARLVLFGVEVGGRWAPEARQFLTQLARRKARDETPFDEAESGLLSSVAARLVAMSLLELPGVLGADGGRWNAILFTPVWREA